MCRKQQLSCIALVCLKKAYRMARLHGLEEDLRLTGRDFDSILSILWVLGKLELYGGILHMWSYIGYILMQVIYTAHAFYQILS